jgi:ribonuclease HI
LLCAKALSGCRPAVTGVDQGGHKKIRHVRRTAGHFGYSDGVDYDNQVVEIYTDGACSGNPGPGGWGVLLRYGRREIELYGSVADTTTSNRMELTAPIRALESLARPSVVRIFTDSTYVQTGITAWLPKWKRNGWLTATKQPVKNVDLWTRLEEAEAPHQVCWLWVKAHAGNRGNEHADRLAVKGMKEAVDARQIPLPRPSSPPIRRAANRYGTQEVLPGLL